MLPLTGRSAARVLLFWQGYLNRPIIAANNLQGPQMRRGWLLLGAAMAAAMAGGALAANRPAILSVSHLAVYAADPARTESFYVQDLGAVKMPDPENPLGTRYYFSPSQFVEVLPLPAGAGINRLDHVAFETYDVEAMRTYLADRNYAVPPRVTHGADGGLWIDVTDPEGNKVQFVETPTSRPAIPVNALSRHIIHVGYVVHDRAKEDGFYRDLLGFRPYWAGGMKDDTPPSWVSQQLPNGTDWLEYMLVPPPDPNSDAPPMTQQRLGVLNHFSLGVVNMEAAYTALWNSDRLEGQPATAVPKIGRDAKWQLNLIDPDGTRAEVMEFHAIGKPCCSPFSATDPDR
jgi:catechol 2,3-dioxygenase-like lactoylglutathione lyase family enzyme